MLSPFRMDLHIHTCLSPCGDAQNVPTRIIRRAWEQKLQGIGICDHNASENVVPVRSAARACGIEVFGGMEITTQEEVHLLALFDDDEMLVRMQEFVYENLPGSNSVDAFGEQYIVDAEDYVIDTNGRLLIGATEIPLEDAIDTVHRWDGLAIASHIDRESFGIISQLGMIPEDLELDAVELSPNHVQSPFDVNDVMFPRVFFSDAHQLSDIGRACTVFLMETPSIAELRKALQGRQGRRIAQQYEAE